MSLELTLATEADAERVAGVRNAATEQLTATFGHGPWTSASSAKSVFSNLGRSRIFVVRRGAELIATFKLERRSRGPSTRTASPPVPVRCT